MRGHSAGSHDAIVAPRSAWRRHAEHGTTGPADLVGATVLIASIWAVMLPRISRHPPFREAIDRREALGINADAMFYTELEAMDTLRVEWDGHGLSPAPLAILKKRPNNEASSPTSAFRIQHSALDAAPYPPSTVITSVRWAPAASIVRRAHGGDNWPLTWGDDDALYTAYGDGRGFKPFIPPKLSLGLARITGGPTDFVGRNLRSPTAEQVGDGVRGKKASGMLMVEDVLYMWVRNADNSQLAWSADHGNSWEWADWRFRTSFGAPTFLNFGPNYAGARDEYVYAYSHDQDSAYEPADRMVLARVPRDRLRERGAYEFFAEANAGGLPQWTRDIAQRAAVFEHRGCCYRSGITYNAPLKRYLWCQVLPGEDTRFSGGFGIYDAPQPWGPWTTVYFTEQWDVGPGETSSLPTKWMSDDGRTMHLVFSGDDYFSVRRVDVE